MLRLLWRRKLVTVPLFLLGIGAAVAIYIVTEPTFRVAGSVVLLNPPAPPVNGPPSANNPFLRFGDESVVVDIVSRIIQTEAVERDLRSRGATAKYTVAANITYYSGPIIDVVAEAATEDGARRTALTVMEEIGRRLESLQVQRGTDPAFHIRAITVVAPDEPKVVSSGRQRRVIAVAAVAGALMTAMALLTDALAARRARRRERKAQRARLATPAADASLLDDTSGESVASPRPAGRS